MTSGPNTAAIISHSSPSSKYNDETSLCRLRLSQSFNSSIHCHSILLSSMAGDDRPLFNDNISVILIAMGSAAFIVTMYHLIAVCLCSQQFSDRNPDQPQPPHRNVPVDGSTATPVALLIPAHKYKKKIDDDVAGHATCAVCLGDFEDGEELRTLPECAHSFHVNCIDTWLNSHRNCPVCRADATPSPAVLRRSLESGPGESEPHDHRLHIIVHNALVQNALMRRWNIVALLP